jgi:hypothetical protein
MERWLSKSWVLLGLCGVLFMAALNRHDPMVYGVFLFLSVVTVLGFLLPWLSLRSMSVRLGQSGDLELTEADACDLQMVVHRAAPWPAFMVDIETEWVWAKQCRSFARGKHRSRVVWRRLRAEGTTAWWQ